MSGYSRNPRHVANAGVQAERVPSRGTGCRARFSDRSWAEGTPKRAEGGALSPSLTKRPKASLAETMQP
jgi:hypothetical protein